jgi:hypothetical protein
MVSCALEKKKFFSPVKIALSVYSKLVVVLKVLMVVTFSKKPLLDCKNYLKLVKL